ncbi:MAG: hypothetical protein ABI885_20315 [Gammaproteobacteria bacterium]
MPLNTRQASELEAAIGEYGFPAVYFDFRANVEVQAETMLAVEAAIHEMLVSPTIEGVRDGLANVIYWGYAQIGYRDSRVRRFREKATDDQLGKCLAQFKTGASGGLARIASFRLPEFSGISFISKILAFLDPVRYCVLDKQLLKLAAVSGNRALHRLSPGTQIRVTAGNERAYDSWRDECANISAQYFGSRYRVVDIERGFFQLVQSGQLAVAQQLYAAA